MMNFWDFFYCNAYEAYSARGTSSKETLRISAISVLTAFHGVNVASVVMLFNFGAGRLLLPAWAIFAMAVILLISFLLRFSLKRTEDVRQEYVELSPKERKRGKTRLLIYKIISGLVVVLMMAASIYLKTTTGYVFK